MLDTKGPELRIRSFKNHKITLKEGDEFTFTVDEIEGDQSRVSVSYKGIVNDLVPGDTILLNNGLLVFKVTEVDGKNVKTKVVIGGELSDKKSMFFPDKTLSLQYLSEQDKKDILFGVEQGIDFIACSFTSKAQDIIDIRNLLEENGNPDIDLIAKIESRSGVNNIDEILSVQTASWLPAATSAWRSPTRNSRRSRKCSSTNAASQENAASQRRKCWNP